jgi:hypothetical protein
VEKRDVDKTEITQGPGDPIQPRPIEIDFLESYDRPALIAELLRIADVLRKSTLSMADVDNYGRVSSECIARKFGSMKAALLAAGLVPARGPSRAELLKILVDLWARTMEDHGRRPLTTDFERYGLKVRPWTFVYRFGSWRKALVAASRFSGSGEVPADEPGRPRRTSMSFRVRFLVFQRDLYRCRICKSSGVKLEVDHILPVSLGGSNDMDNLQALCVPCNRGKSNSRQ